MVVLSSSSTFSGMEKRRLLIALPAQEGKPPVHAYIHARSPAELSERVPTVEVIDPEPEWLTDEQKARIGAAKEFDIDSPLDVRMLTTQPEILFDADSPPPWRQ